MTHRAGEAGEAKERYMLDENEQPRTETICGNERHPDGPWHRATPLPFYPGWTARFTKKGRLQRRAVWRYQANTSKWGCGCDSDIGQRLIVAQNLLEQVHKASGNWTTPSAWNEQRKEFLRRG